MIRDDNDLRTWNSGIASTFYGIGDPIVNITGVSILGRFAYDANASNGSTIRWTVPANCSLACILVTGVTTPSSGSVTIAQYDSLDTTQIIALPFTLGSQGEVIGNNYFVNLQPYNVILYKQSILRLTFSLGISISRASVIFSKVIVDEVRVNG